MTLESFPKNKNTQESKKEQSIKPGLSEEELDERFLVRKIEEREEEKGLSDKELEEIKETVRHLRPSKGTTIATNAADFIPVVGSGKMIMEAVRGKQYGTDNKIKGAGRVVHGVAGAAFLAADLSGAGAVASAGGKILMRGGMKMAGRGAEKMVAKSTERLGEKALEREAQKKILKRESLKLYDRGKERRKRQEKLASRGLDEDFEGDGEYN
ncbi:MAG: hypothetical protein PHQ01_02660 [Candidatus Pacebacteria bacterium]|jgi:hypothetical protein|nr:hypothetical protein [Candidatus Paceibacterota bacterium]